MDYRSTLNLPKTDFPMKASLTHLEERMLAFWQDIDIYSLILKNKQSAPKYILHDGPPYANGLIHIGHALNKILKDIVIKYKSLQGFFCPYVPGWDCHGLPIEHQLLKKTGSSLTKNHLLFREKAREFALKYVDMQKQDFKKLGVFGDWENPYLTLAPEYETVVLSALRALFLNGYIVRGFKPVNWCPNCRTALAEAEIEYADKISPSIYIKFKVLDGKGILKEKDTFFLVWTTTPWTLMANTAVALGRRFVYTLAETPEGERLVFLKELLGQIQEKKNAEFDVIKEFSAEELEGIICRHPFLNRQSKVILADFVSKEDGTGCVHIAPGHGEEDFEAGRQYNLEVIMPVDEAGRFFNTEKFSGENIYKANPLIIEEMANKGTLFLSEEITHSYPHCWRCKKPTIFRATKQWFFNVDHRGLRQKLLEAIEKVKWVPAQGKERISAMVSLRPQWCISRQRLWGVPIPAVKCKSCGEEFLNEEVLNNVAGITRKEGSNCWFSKNLEEFLPIRLKCPYCGAEEFEKGKDILDVWFESGASFSAVLKNNPSLKFPADLYLEGSDQHRGWFQLSLILSAALENVPAFKKALTHGFVVDSEGRKMSKSIGNVISPQEIIQKYGAEILRLWAFYSDFNDDIKISPEIIKQLTDSYRKIRNTLRFIMGNLYDFSIDKHGLDYEKILPIDKYILSQTAQMQEQAVKYYEEFKFYKAFQTIYTFCNQTLSSFYLDILKDRLYTYALNSKARRSAQTVLWHIADLLIKITAPFLSFTAEEAYGYFNCPDKKQSVFLEEFPDLNKFRNPDIDAEFGRIFSLRNNVLKVLEEKRGQKVIGSSLEAKIVLSFSDAEKAEFFQSRTDILKEVFIVSQIEIKTGKDEIRAEKADGEKCPRCWIFSTELSSNGRYSGICPKCLDALTQQEGGGNNAGKEKNG